MAYIEQRAGYKITGGNTSIDERIYLSKAEMLRESNDSTAQYFLPNKYFCICKDDGKIYTYDSTNTMDPTLGKYRLVDVDLSNYATIAYVDSEDNALQEEIDSVDSRVDAIETRIPATGMIATRPWVNAQGFIKSDSLNNYYTKTQTDSAISNYHDASKQNKLTAGANITIQNDIISATGSTTTVNWGSITGVMANQTDLNTALNNKLAIGSNISNLVNNMNYVTNTYHDASKQDKLTAGANITISANNVISASGTIGTDWSNITNKPDFKAVATSGSYNDLSNKPTIPTKTSDLTNDSGFLTSAVTDVKVNNTSCVTSGVANIPIMNNFNQYGVMTIRPNYGLNIGSACAPYLQPATNDAITSRTTYTNTGFGAILPQNIDYAVKAALTDGVGTAYTDSEKQAARTRVGVRKIDMSYNSTTGVLSITEEA